MDNLNDRYEQSTGMKSFSRRDLLKTTGLAAAGLFIPEDSSFIRKPGAIKFEYCLNASSIKEQAPGVLMFIEIASRAGYDSVELWESNIRSYIEENNSLKSLKKFIDDSHLTVASACGIKYAPWMVEDEQESKTGLEKMEEVMNLFAELGCRRMVITLPGNKDGKPVDLFKVGERYSRLLETGRKTGVMPHIEFIGGSKTCSHIGQAFLVIAAANDPDGRMAADIFHIFKGGSDFNGLKMVNGCIIEIVHMNDFTDTIPFEKQSDMNRIYPGDGVAPMNQIINDIKNMGGTKVLSLELFNKDYWKQDPLIVAQTGIDKMKRVVKLAESA